MLPKKLRKDSRALTLYHTTKQKHIKSILQNGLIPNFKPDNSQSIEDDRKGIFLCPKESIPYWLIILEHDALLSVTIPDDAYTDSFSYTYYEEQIYNDVILPEHIKIEPLPEQSELKQANETLCDSAINALSNITSHCARFYDNMANDLKYHEAYMESRTSMIRATGEKINFAIISDETKTKILRELGDSGEYTFCDTYKNTPIRLWEQLSDYPKDSTYEKRIYIQNFIKKHFKNVLFTNTGGYTGSV